MVTRARAHLQAFIAGYAGTMQITEGFLLSAAVLMETAIAMTLLSRTLQYRARYVSVSYANTSPCFVSLLKSLSFELSSSSVAIAVAAIRISASWMSSPDSLSSV